MEVEKKIKVMHIKTKPFLQLRNGNCILAGEKQMSKKIEGMITRVRRYLELHIRIS